MWYVNSGEVGKNIFVILNLFQNLILLSPFKDTVHTLYLWEREETLAFCLQNVSVSGEGEELFWCGCDHTLLYFLKVSSLVQKIHLNNS